ncbi:uncharacterized protein LOC129907541 [Episyrphus balteatus]|uniref:uncharacterized protein LOC129907541 n=1 Tax=Episyrphus balteatus TaxID=286459 RepID=UPI0024865D50|nr:uncharacterized protein LOC129907541 [Episyrphus balteatus]
MNLLKFCLIDCNYFNFKDKIIRMKTGLFMGSSLAPILVEWVLDEVIQEAFQKIDFVPQFWMAYVDDHLTAVPKNKVNMIKTALESFDGNILFTYETENVVTKEINYLDLTIKRNEDGSIITNWFHKPIASNRLINYYSAHPINMKYNTVKSFIRKVFSFSHKIYMENNIERINRILIKNNYPVQVINKLIKCVQNENFKNRTKSPNKYSRRSYQFLSETKDETVIRDTKIYSSITYIPGLSESLAKKCEYFVPEIKTAMRPNNKVSHFFANTKSKIEKTNKSGVVYSIPCNDCPKIYIGETIQKLGCRINQHKNECKKVLEGSSYKNIAALAEHTKQNGHSFKFDETKILKSENQKFKLQVHEVNQIIKYEEIACNFKTDKKDYSNTYHNLIVSS